MSKQSYFDWQRSLRKKKKGVKKEVAENSLGIPQAEFKSFMREWRKKNLPKAKTLDDYSFLK